MAHAQSRQQTASSASDQFNFSSSIFTPFYALTLPPPQHPFMERAQKVERILSNLDEHHRAVRRNISASILSTSDSLISSARKQLKQLEDEASSVEGWAGKVQQAVSKRQEEEVKRKEHQRAMHEMVKNLRGKAKSDAVEGEYEVRSTDFQEADRTMKIVVGDEIRIEKFVSGKMYHGQNLSSGKNGQFKEDVFRWEDTRQDGREDRHLPGKGRVPHPDGDGDIEMGGMREDLNGNGRANGSRRLTETEIREKLSKALKDLVDEGVKQLEEYDTHTKRVRKQYEEALEREKLRTGSLSALTTSGPGMGASMGTSSGSGSRGILSNAFIQSPVDEEQIRRTSTGMPVICQARPPVGAYETFEQLARRDRSK